MHYDSRRPNTDFDIIGNYVEVREDLGSGSAIISESGDLVRSAAHFAGTVVSLSACMIIYGLPNCPRALERPRIVAAARGGAVGWPFWCRARERALKEGTRLFLPEPGGLPGRCNHPPEVSSLRQTGRMESKRGTTARASYTQAALLIAIFADSQ